MTLHPAARRREKISREPTGCAWGQSPIATGKFFMQYAVPSTQQNLEFMMTAYLPALVWALSALVCLFIAKRRHVRNTSLRAMAVVLLGPLAIPFVLAAKPESFGEA